VQHVVVYLKHAPPGPAAPVRVAIRQRGETFLPRVVAVPVGSEVAFPNEDHIYHNVFSLSRARTFNLGRYPFGRSGSVRVDTPGVVKVFCDIHSHMSATVLVFNHPWFAVPDAQGRFALDEYEQIKQHPALGARILREVPFLAPHLPIVELHHERPDGKGYPHGLTAEAIPLDASIVHVADAFDAMTGARAYRPARPAAAAIEELRRHMGTQFDAASVEALGAALRDAGSDAAPPAANVLERAS
jgi:plastocyanin